MERHEIARYHTPQKHLDVVLFYLPTKEEYVTWIYNISFDGFAYGNYFNDLDSALLDFAKRCLEYKHN